MSTEFYHPLPHPHSVTIRKSPAPTDAAIRLYCWQAGEAWNLQIRGAEQLKNYHRGVHDYIATASLNRANLEQLRDAINAALAE